MSQRNFVEEIKTHCLSSIIFFENRAFNQIMFKNILEPDTPTDYNMAHAHCMLET